MAIYKISEGDVLLHLKKDQENLSDNEKNVLRKLVKALKQETARNRR